MRILLAIVLALCISNVQTAPATPPANTISNPRLVLHKNKHLLQIKWYQYVQSSPKLVVAFKVTNTRQIKTPECVDVDWARYITESEGFTYCYNLLQQRVQATGWLTATDPKWHKGDQYYLIQYDFSTHNAPYGPFIPR